MDPPGSLGSPEKTEAGYKQGLKNELMDSVSCDLVVCICVIVSLMLKTVMIQFRAIAVE